MAIKGLGRGLDALLPTAAGDTAAKRSETALSIPLDKLVPNPDQPRKCFSKESLEELARSIRNEGVIQPLLVRKGRIPGEYEIIAGERRWRAARLAGLTELPVYVRNLTDSEVMVASLVENLQREDLNPVEEARAMLELKNRLSLTQEELATRIGKSRSMVANALRLLQLPAGALDSLQSGKITAGHARSLLMLDQEDAVQELLARILGWSLTVRDCEDAVSYWKKNAEFPWIAEGKEGESASAPAPIRKARRIKTPLMKNIEKSLSQHLSCKAVLSGAEGCGKLSLSYSSEEELVRILTALGLTKVLELEEEDADKA